jgi:Resolvase, N terminal domain
MPNARAYLRASSDEQDASRGGEQVEAFGAERGLSIVGTYLENESGAKLARPELFRLLADSKPGDVLLVEQVDRLSRLTDADWRKLRAQIDAKQVRIVALDLSTSGNLQRRATSSSRACSGLSTGCSLICWLQSPVRTTRTAGAAKRKASRRRSARESTEAGQRTRPQRRHRRYAALWNDLDGHSGGYGLQRATIAKVARRAA